MPELAVIIVVALVVLGPKRLPEVARSLGKGLAEFRRLTGDVNKELEAARHMIESEARDHENERRKSDRESRQPQSTAPLAGSDPSESTDETGTPPSQPAGKPAATLGTQSIAGAPVARATESTQKDSLETNGAELPPDRDGEG
jgi:sec-independent protein translocase protein TatB